MKTFWRILAFAPPFVSYGPAYLLTSLLGVIFGAVNLALLIPLLQVLFDTGGPTGPALAQPPTFVLGTTYFQDLFNYYFGQVVSQYGKFAALQYVCAVLIGSVFLANLFLYWSQRIMNRLCQDLVRNVRRQLFDHLLYLHLGYFAGERKGDLMARATNDVLEIEYTAIIVLKSVLKEPLTILVLFGMLFYISAELTLFALFFLPISGGVIALVTRRLRKEGRQRQDTLGQLLNMVDEALGGLKVINAFNARQYIRQKFDKKNTEYRDVTKGLENRRDLASPLSQLMGVMVVAGILLYGGNLVLGGNGSLDGASFITYIAVFTQILTPAKALAAMYTGMSRSVAPIERVLEVLHAPSRIVDQAGAGHIAELRQGIQIDNVWFAYDGKPVLKGIDLTVGKGQVVALVGASGGGKSTLADLIPRFHDPTAGSIRLDGTDLRELRLESVRALMGIVTQEPILFNDTVFNNIAFGIEGAREEDVVRAAMIAHAHGFIAQLEHGYQTNIGDRGSRLSGGQRQRLSIARAVLKNPAILILDEATSALDSESEHLVQDAIAHLMQNRTSLVIAHRLSTIQHADQIVVIHEGQVVEQGTHEQLLAAGGAYSKMVGLQSVA
jgi:ATP-binding cassette, subfamily B, bacterial MsbA